MNHVLKALAADRDRIVLQDSRDVFSAGHALDTLYRVGRALSDRGVGPGATVALMGPISTRMYLLSHAVQLVGAAQAEVPLAMPAEAQVRFMAECGTTHVAADPDEVRSEALLSAADPPDADIFSLTASNASDDLFTIAESYSAAPFTSSARAGDPVRISLTGGTTGRAKPVLRRFGPALAGGSRTLAGLLSGGDAPPRALVADRPTGLIRTFADATVMTGGRVVALPDFEPAPLLAAMACERITHTVIPAHTLRRLLEHPHSTGTDLSPLRCVVAGGGIVSPALLRRAVHRLGPIVHVSYGQTEAGNITFLSPKHYTQEGSGGARTVGRPTPGVDVVIRTPEEQEATAGERGRVWVRSPLMMDGYLNRPQATERVIRDGWLDTGDVGALDGNGLLTLLGRSTDAMAIGGRTVFSSEVDGVLQEHPGVLDSATFAMPGGEGSTLHSAIVPRPGCGLPEHELRARVDAELGSGHVPSSFLLVSHVPHTYAHELCWDTLRRWRAAAPL